MSTGYRPGGFHPIHIGDTFNSGRYTVVHILGYGAFSTVWLAKDSATETYVALKVLAENASKWSGNVDSVNEELRVLLRLRDGADAPGKDDVLQLIDYFYHTGPNGVHQCIVTELLGPEVGVDIDILPWSVGRAIIRGAANAIRYLHRNNIVHGDLHPGNVLFASQIFSSLSPSDIVRYYGEVEKEDWAPTDADGRPPHAPEYLVEPGDATALIQSCVDDPAGARVKICDFSESSIITDKTHPKRANMHLVRKAPELMLVPEYTPTFSADIWALAVLFYAVVSGGQSLFLAENRYRAPTEDAMLQEMVLRIGKLPEPVWSAWPNRAEYFEEDGTSRDGHAAGTQQFFSRDHRYLIEDPEECILFERMLRNMVKLEPEMRSTIDDVMNSDWFVKYCMDASVR